MDLDTDCDQSDYPDPGADDGNDPTAYEPEDRYRDPDYYWRRRFLVLAGGLAIVGLIAGGLSALLGPAKPLDPRGAAHASLAVRDTLPPAALGYPAGSRPSSPPPSAAASPGAPASPGSARVPAGSSPACSPSAIVLSLFTAKAQYSPTQQPQFKVYAVSTAPGICALAFGPSFVQIVVVRHGQVLWDSAECPAGTPAASLVRFTQGVPRVAVLSWNRKSRTSGCAGSVFAGTWGRVDAVALADGRTSPMRSFTLSR
jgi:hypothetical protein